MNPVYFTKTAIATGLADSLDQNWQKLMSGESAIKPINYFKTDRLDYHKASFMHNLRSDPNANHLCELTKLVLKQIGEVPENTQIIWTGIKGNAEYIESGQKMDKPYLPMHYRDWVAVQLGIDNLGIEVNAACASSTVGTALAAQKISGAECHSVLVCAADLASRFVHCGFSALKALSANTVRPFDKKRDGLALGDGAVAILLTDKETAEEKGYPLLGRLTGWGIANDANHITGPARDGCGLILAIESTLKMAGMKADDIEAFCAHGTGTVYNDKMELAAVEKIFGDKSLPIFSVKGAIGHTLGAAGGIEAALCLSALREKTVPPTIGLVNSEAQAQNRISNKARLFEGNNILTTNSGFGGVNAALIIEKE
jgi:3-oxoacyl-[acyl-carrier-protein] synthase II